MDKCLHLFSKKDYAQEHPASSINLPAILKRRGFSTKTLYPYCWPLKILYFCNKWMFSLENPVEPITRSMSSYIDRE